MATVVLPEVLVEAFPAGVVQVAAVLESHELLTHRV
jgi:hypothetical protein